MGTVPEIAELYVLPPLAIARFGSSPEPMDNYEVVVTDATGYRQLRVAPTLVVDEASGEIRDEITPQEVLFRDAQRRVRPLCPFFEAWVRFAGADELEPLTAQHLAEMSAGPATVEWRVRAGNYKAFRRTGKPGDRVQADTGYFGDNAAHKIEGRAVNFKAGKSIPFGTIRYVRPNARFPEIRARFTPGPGRSYGPNPDDPLSVDDVYDAAKGTWAGYWDGDEGFPIPTFPAGTYEGTFDAQKQRYISGGYFDDSCDAIVEVRVTVGDRAHSGFARVASAVPDFAPDGRHVRSLADDLEQCLLGPEFTGPVDRDKVADIVRRALETVRLMNTSAMNGDQGIGGVATNATNNGFHEFREYKRALEPMFGQGNAPYNAVLARHVQLAGSWAAGGPLALPANLLRRYDEAGDFSNPIRHKMPAMMRGSDTLELTLTRRNFDILRQAAGNEQGAGAPSTEAGAPSAQVPLGIAAATRAPAFAAQEAEALPGAFSAIVPGSRSPGRGLVSRWILNYSSRESDEAKPEGER